MELEQEAKATSRAGTGFVGCSGQRARVLGPACQGRRRFDIVSSAATERAASVGGGDRGGGGRGEVKPRRAGSSLSSISAILLARDDDETRASSAAGSGRAEYQREACMHGGRADGGRRRRKEELRSQSLSQLWSVRCSRTRRRYRATPYACTTCFHLVYDEDWRKYTCCDPLRIMAMVSGWYRVSVYVSLWRCAVCMPMTDGSHRDCDENSRSSQLLW